MKKKEFKDLRALDEAIVDGLQAQLRELEERVSALVLNARADARTMAGLRRRIKEKNSLISKLRNAYNEADAWLETENSLKNKAVAEAEKARAFARKYEGERNMFFDRAVAAETKLDAAKVEVENKKAWYDMKLVGEVALRTQLEERIRELEGRS